MAAYNTSLYLINFYYEHFYVSQILNSTLPELSKLMSAEFALLQTDEFLLAVLYLA